MMEGLRLDRVKLNAEVLTPIHIGDGSDLEPLEYVIADGHLYQIDTGSFLSSLSQGAAAEMDTLLKGEIERVTLVKIRKFIQEHFKPDAGFLWKSSVTPTVARIYKERFGAPENQMLVNPFIRNHNTPFIPGSSLKGAIRTALLNQWSNELKKPSDERNSRLTEAEILKSVAIGRDNRLRPNMDKDPFKALRVEDISLPEDATIFAKVSNWALSREGTLRETNIQMIRELTSSAISSGKTFGVDVFISLDNRFLVDRRSDLGRKEDISVEGMLKACDRFYRRVLLDEKKRLFDGKNRELAATYEHVLDASSGGALLRIGWASGFDAMTITKFRHRSTWGRSKHLAESKYPLGWMKLALS